MMFYMNSKVFKKYFLVNEYDDDILDAQYVIVSTRIRIRDRTNFDNIIKATDDLFPNPEVCSVIDEETFRERYFDQLNSSKLLLSYFIKGSIEEGYNIIFICSKNEDKIGYLKLLSDFIYLEFGYPVYEYMRYSLGVSKLIKYNKNEIIKECNKIIENAKNNHLDELIQTDEGKKEIHKSIKRLSTKELKKELKKINMYSSSMSKKDMIDVYELYLLD